MINVPHSREAILEQLRKITSSSLFEKAGRSRALLEYLVQESVSGRADVLKEYTIGSEGLGKGDSFDPRTDTIVRAEASRLRSRLERYYAAEGKIDPLVIVLPKGSYALDFREPDRREESVGILPELKPASRLPWAVGALAILCLIGLLSWKWNSFMKPVEPSRLTFEVELKVPGVVGSGLGTDVIISPDGTRLVFAVQGKDGVSRLNVHQLDQSRTRELPGTEGARGQFFSAESNWIGFWAAGQIKKTPLNGGSPIVLCEATDLQGASWPEGDSIVAAFGDGKLWRIPASGGPPRLILDGARDTVRPSAPQVLSGQNAVLFTTVGADPAQNRIAVYSLSTGTTKVVAQGSTYGRYLPNGYLAYMRQGTLYAAPFDLNRLETTGTAVPILDGVAYDSTFGYGCTAIK